MSRNVAGTYSLPSGSLVTDGVDDILASQHNTPLQDIAADLNIPRPIVAGGTGESSVAGIKTMLGISAFAQTFLDDADAAEVRATIGAAPQSQNGAGAGQVQAIASTVGGALALPAGGTWEYFAWRNDSTSGVDSFVIAGVAAGGTTIVGAVAGVVHLGRAKRILA